MRKLLVTILMLACLGSPAFAAALPLKPGGYVEIGTRCADGSDATSLDYLGDVIQAAGTTASNETVLSRRGNAYLLSATIRDNQSGISEVSTETVTIHSPTAFRLKSKYGTADYRWCGKGSAL